MLRGGVGLGVVTSITLRLRKVSSLNLEGGDKVVQYTALFPRDAFEFAARLYTSMLPVKDTRLTLGCLVMIAPPPMGPLAGKPVFMIDALFIGSKSEGDKALRPLLSDDSKAKALTVTAQPVLLAKMNEKGDGRFKRGVYLDTFSSFMENVSGETINLATSHWLEFGDKVGSSLSGKTVLNLASVSTEGPRKADPQGETGLSHRSRSFLARTFVIGLELDEVNRVGIFAEQIKEIMRRDDRAKGIVDGAFASNIKAGTDMKEVYVPGKLRALEELKRHYDPDGMFWNPAVNGWGP